MGTVEPDVPETTDDRPTDDGGTDRSGSRFTRRTFVLGGVGLAAIGGASGSGAAQQGENEQRQVEMNDQLQYVPRDITIRPGDTVVWVNVGTVPHSVTAYDDGIPEEAAYFASGEAGSEEQARNTYPEQGELGADDQFRHTFQTEGTFEYFCIPHEQVDMIGTVEVTSQPAGGTGGDVEPVVPDSVMTLGVVLTLAMTSVLGLAYFFLKYGGDYEKIE